jgi:hypothetical protein
MFSLFMKKNKAIRDIPMLLQRQSLLLGTRETFNDPRPVLMLELLDLLVYKINNNLILNYNF